MEVYKPFLAYSSRREFYAARGGRFSPELDFGVHNTDPANPQRQRYQVTLVADTGDLYAKQIYHPERLYVLGRIQRPDLTRMEELWNYGKSLFDAYNAEEPGQTLGWFANQLAQAGARIVDTKQPTADPPEPEAAATATPHQPESEPE